MDDEQLPPLAAHEWELCGEGARNLVLRYRGDAPRLAGCVLRLPKTPADAATEDTGGAHAALEHELWGHLAAHGGAAAHDAHRGALFVAHVLAPLLGARHACAGTPLPVPAAFVRAVAAACGRGAALHADVLASGTVAVLLPDAARFAPVRGTASSRAAPPAPVLAVELKPKCGFLPRSPAVPRGSAKRRVSRYVMHQHLKAAEGRVAQVSGYCPLDLFSAEPARVDAALRALLAAPHNNLTVRRDGRPVFGGAGMFGQTAQSDVASLCAALEGVAPDGAPPAARLELLLRLLAAALRAHGVLPRLLAAQQLDAHDVEGAFQAYAVLMGEPFHDDAAAAAEDACPARGDDAEAASALSQLRALPRGRALAVLRDFLTAQTAKDCALMLALQRLPDDAADDCFDDGDGDGAVVLLHDAPSGLRFRCKAAFLDLDMKPARKLPHYLALDRRVVAAYRRATAANGAAP